MTTFKEWKGFFYADISAQLRRHGVNSAMFDGLYLSINSIVGAWLDIELNFKWAALGDHRDKMFVMVIRGGAESETWNLVWRRKSGQDSVHHSVDNFPGARTDKNHRVAIRDCIWPTLPADDSGDKQNAPKGLKGLELMKKFDKARASGEYFGARLAAVVSWLCIMFGFEAIAWAISDEL